MSFPVALLVIPSGSLQEAAQAQAPAFPALPVEEPVEAPKDLERSFSERPGIPWSPWTPGAPWAWDVGGWQLGQIGQGWPKKNTIG